MRDDPSIHNPSVCDYPSIQPRIIQLLVPLLHILGVSKDVQQREDVIHIFLSLWNNQALRNVLSISFFHIGSMSQSNDHFPDQIVGRTCQRSPCRVVRCREDKGQSRCVGKGDAAQPLSAPSQSHSPVLSIGCVIACNHYSDYQVGKRFSSYRRLACTIPAAYMYSILPSISSLLMHPSTSSLYASQGSLSQLSQRNPNQSSQGNSNQSS